MEDFDIDVKDDHFMELGLIILTIVWCVIVSISAIVLTAYIFICCKRRASHTHVRDSNTESQLSRPSDGSLRLRGVRTLVTSILVRSHNFVVTLPQVQETDTGVGSSSLDPFEAAWRDLKDALTRSVLDAQSSVGGVENHNVSSRASYNGEVEAEMTELVSCEEEMKAQDYVDAICCSSIQNTSRPNDVAPEKVLSSYISRSDNEAGPSSSMKQDEGDREKIDDFAPGLLTRSRSLSRARSDWFEQTLLSRSNSVSRREYQSSDLSKTLTSDTDLSAGVGGI